MRIYGIRSGRNNMNRLLARSIMFNSKNKSKNVKTTVNNNNTDTNSILIIAYIIIFVLVILCCR